MTYWYSIASLPVSLPPSLPPSDLAKQGRSLRTSPLLPFAPSLPPFVQTKMQLMAKEAALAEESALFTLHETEGKATIEELDRVAADLERDKTEAEAELKRHLHVRFCVFCNRLGFCGFCPLTDNSVNAVAFDTESPTYRTFTTCPRFNKSMYNYVWTTTALEKLFS